MNIRMPTHEEIYVSKGGAAIVDLFDAVSKQVEKLARSLMKNNYGQYLLDMLAHEKRSTI